MNQQMFFLLIILVTAVVLTAGCSSPNNSMGNQTESGATPPTASVQEQTPVTESAPAPCGRTSCQGSESCCNGFCINPAVSCCCNGKPCQGSCCNVSGYERCYDPEKQECCEGTLCSRGSCCAGTCSPSGGYFCVYVNGTGCYGLPSYVNCTWNGNGYKLVRTNVPFGEPEPSYLDIVIIPATTDRSHISEYWTIPALGSGGGTPATRVRIV
jgi:hypothetical protein